MTTELIRGRIETLENENTVFTKYSAQARPGESTSGVIFQHYGFKSVPPLGADIIHLQDGNNAYAVAEVWSAGGFKNLAESDVLIYTQSGMGISLANGDSTAKAAITLHDLNFENQIILDADASSITLSTKNNEIEILEQQNTITLDSGVGVNNAVLLVDGNNGAINLSGNLKVVTTPALLGTLAPVATKALVDALVTFITACSVATDPHVAEIKAAAITFLVNVPTTFVTQATEAA